MKNGVAAASQANIDAAVTANNAFLGKSGAAAATPYTVTLAASLNDGVYDIVAVDPAGNVSSIVPGWLTVDNTPPATPTETTPVTTPTTDNTPDVVINVAEASGQSIKVYSGGILFQTVNSPAMGNNTVTLTTIPDGSVANFTATFLDEAGNESSPLTLTTFVVDTTKPVVATATASPSPAKAGNVTVTVTFTEAGSGINKMVAPTIQFNDGADHAVTALVDGTHTNNGYDNSANTWVGTVDVTGFTDGSGAIKVSGTTDLAGNVMDANNTAGALMVDQVAPVIGVTSGTDAGPVKSDTINLALSDVTSGVNASTAAYGFSADNTCDITDTYGTAFTGGVNFTVAGDHTDYLCAKAVDNAGNIAYQLVGQLNTDNTAPTNQNTVFAASVSKQSGASVTIVSSGDVTNNVWFAPSGTTTFVAGATMTKATDGTSTAILAPATEGAYKLFVLDAAGNISSASTATLTVDSTSPVATLYYSKDGGTSTGTTIGVKDADTLRIIANFNEPIEDAPIVQVAVNNAVLAATNMTKVDTTHYTYDLNVPAGDIATATVTLSTGEDAAGNVVTATPVNNTFSIDNTAPGFTDVDATAAGPVKTDTINVTLSDAISGVKASTVAYGFSADNTCDVTDTYGTAFTGGTNFTIAGDHTDYLCVTAADNAGNIGYHLVGQLNTDNTAPTNQDTVLAASVIKQGGASVTIVTSGTASNDVWLAASGTTTFVAGATMTKATNGVATTILAPATEGVYNLFVIDAAGNISTASTATVTVDNTAPTAPTVLTPNGGEKLKGGAGYNITWTGGTDAHLGATPMTIDYSALGDFTDSVTINNEANDGTYAWTIPMSNVNTAKVRVTITDQAGNTANDISDLAFTIDSTAPTVSTLSPLDNATSVAVTTAPAITFSEPIATGSVSVGCNNVQLKKYSDDSVIAATCAFSNSNQTVTLTPADNLTPGTQYYFAVNTSVTDVVGNAFAVAYDSTNKTAHEFTTIADTTAPTTMSITPAGAQTVAAVAPVVFTFADNMLFNSTALSNVIEFTLDGNDVKSDLKTSVARPTATSLTVTYTDANLAAGTHNFIAKVQDNAGNWTLANGVVVVGSGTITPTVVLNGAAILSAYSATAAAARFGSGLQIDTTNAASMTVNGTPVAPAATVAIDTLSGATSIGVHTYNIIVTSSTSTTANLTISYQVNADTPADASAPVFVSSAPSNAATSVSVTAGTGTILYNEALVMADETKVLIQKVSDSSSVKVGTAVVSGNNIQVGYGTLEYNTTYRITIQPNAVKDATNNLVTESREIYFTTQSASAPDITGLSIGSVTNTGAVISYTTDVLPTTSQYRISTLAYSGSWVTLAASPAAVAGLAANTTYYYQVRFTANGQTVNSVPMAFKTAAANTGIVVNSIARIPHGTPVVAGDFTNGYHFRFNVTANSLTETGASLKLADWSNTVGTLAIAGNTKMVVSQDGVADYATASGSAVDVTNAYGTNVSISAFDADVNTGGRQFTIDLFYKIPTGAAGAYSTSYGIQTQ